MAEFDEDINLEESDNFLSGVTSVTAAAVGGAALRSALVKGQEFAGGHMSNIVINKAKEQNMVMKVLGIKPGDRFYGKDVSQIKKMKLTVDNALYSYQRDAQELISKAVKASKAPSVQSYVPSIEDFEDFAEYRSSNETPFFRETASKMGDTKRLAQASMKNPYMEALDEINRVLPQDKRIGTPIIKDGKLIYDYSKIDINDKKLMKKLGKRLYGIGNTGVVDAIKQIPAKTSHAFGGASNSYNDGITSILNEADYLNQKQTEILDGTLPKDSKLGRLGRTLRHERLSKPLVKLTHGGELTPDDINIFRNEGLSPPKQGRPGAFLQKMHKGVIETQGLSKYSNITFNKVKHRGDRRGLVGSAKNSWSYHIQQGVQERIALDQHFAKGKQYLNYNITHKELNRIADEVALSLSKNRSLGPSYAHSQDSIERGLNLFKRNVDIQSHKIGGKSRTVLVTNFSPLNKPNFLLGGVNANVATYIRTVHKKNPFGSKKKGSRIKSLKAFTSLMVTDKYDIAGGIFQDSTHIVYDEYTDDPQIKDKKKAATHRKYKKPTTAEGRLNQAITKRDYKKAASELKKVAQQKFSRTKKSLPGKLISKAAKRMPKGSGKMGLVLGSAALAAIAIDRFLKPDDDS